MNLAEVLQRCKAILQHHYQSRFQGLVVYGSVARRQATPESDIDLLVLLSPPFDHFRELRTIVELLYPVQPECVQLISAQPAAPDDFERGVVMFYRRAQREGMRV